MLFIHDNKCEQIQSGFINLSSFSGEVKTKLQNATTQDNVNEEGNDELIEGVDQQNNDKNNNYFPVSTKGKDTSKDTTQSGVLVIEVHDSGAGVSAENQARLFKEIVQFDPEKLQACGGSGLGLFISKSIVDMHEGVISVRSEGEGHGSTFRLEIPMTRRIKRSLSKSISTSTTTTPSKTVSSKISNDLNTSSTLTSSIDNNHNTTTNVTTDSSMLLESNSSTLTAPSELVSTPLATATETEITNNINKSLFTENVPQPLPLPQPTVTQLESVTADMIPSTTNNITVPLKIKKFLIVDDNLYDT